MKTASQFAEEISAIAADLSIVPGEPVAEEIADWRGPLQGIQVDLRRMIQQDIDKFMESAQKIVQRAEESGWSKLVIQNEVKRWSGDVNRVYAKFKNATQGFTDLVKMMGIPTRRHSTKGKAPGKGRGKMDWGSLSQPQLKKEVKDQLNRLSHGIHSLADDGAYMLHQIDRILKYKAPKDETIVEEIGALFQDFVDFRNAFGSKVWGPYKGLMGRLDSIKAPPLKAQGQEYRKTMRKRPMKTMPPTPQFPASMVASRLPVDCPELREAIARDEERARRAVMGITSDEGQGLVESIERELLGEAGDDIVFHKKYKGVGEFRIRRAQKRTRMLRPGGKVAEVFVAEFKSGNRWEPQPQDDDTFEGAKKAIKQLVRAVVAGDRGKGRGVLSAESIDREAYLGEADELEQASLFEEPMEEAEASKMKAKGYKFKILLKDKPPLYAKTEKGAKEVQADYPGSKVVANESGEIDDPELVESVEDMDLLESFEDFDELLYGEGEEPEPRPFDEAGPEEELSERQKTTTAAIGQEFYPGTTKPVMTRQGAFKLSDKELQMFSKEGITPDKMLFSGQQKVFMDIPRDKLPEVIGAVDIPDAQDELNRNPKGAIQKFMLNIGKVSPKAGKMLRAVPENAALYFYLYAMRVSGRDMANILLKRYLTTHQAFKPVKREDVEEPEETSLEEMSSIVKTIYQQFGGGRAMAMIGGQVHDVDANTLGIKWPNKKRSKGNYVEIRYNAGKDLYDMEFFNVSVQAKKSVKKYKDVGWEQLADIFERQTGWYVRM